MQAYAPTPCLVEQKLALSHWLSIGDFEPICLGDERRRLYQHANQHPGGIVLFHAVS
jgi:hypothetical protein